MGLDINSVRFLIDARLRGAEFGEVLTFGRQDLNVFPAQMVKLLTKHGFSAQAFAGNQKALHAEPAFQSLGATKVHSMDVSGFEGATFIHDLNQPIGDPLKERFDVVYDGGTLEHIFNFPTALRNCMEMVKQGGLFFTHTVANNWCGHGFYQFSPELFYRALAAESGYKVERMILHQAGPYGRWYEVMDPEQIRSRVELLTCLPYMLLVQARRVQIRPVLVQAPQQSDYTPRWNDSGQVGTEPAVSRYGAPRPWLARFLPRLARLFNVLKILFGLLRNYPFFNRKSLRPVKKP